MNNGIAQFINLKRAAVRDKDLEISPDAEDRESQDLLKVYNDERPRHDLRKPKVLQADVKESFMGVEQNLVDSYGRVIGDVRPNSLYVHVTAFFTVDVDPKTDYYITPETSDFVNSNGDAWERKLATIRFGKDFPGAFNFEEHIQIPVLNRGRVIDTYGKILPKTMAIDALIRVDDSIVINDVIMGLYNAVSIGCSYEFAFCSQCGRKFTPDDERCTHLVNNLKGYFKDENGIWRRVAELVGHWKNPESIEYYELSWVRNPAFKGADVHSYLKHSAKEIRLSDLFTFSNMVNISLILPKIRKAPYRERIFLVSAAYFILSSDLSNWQKTIIMVALSKLETPKSYFSVPLYISKLVGVAGASVGTTKLKGIFTKVQSYLRTH